jgi:vacuolar-type H+-ATPase subunit D/Vma8
VRKGIDLLTRKRQALVADLLRVAPGLTGEIHRVRALLEEREREDHTRLKHLLRVRKVSRS